MIILLHSSKTMRAHSQNQALVQSPQFMAEARRIDAYLKTLTTTQLEKVMHVSPALAVKARRQITEWGSGVATAAIDSFIGDIYSGLQVETFNEADRAYANDQLRILSGLYGVLRPNDGIEPYRLEMGYRLPDASFTNLYAYWGEKIAKSFPPHELIINTSSVEYSQTVVPYVDIERIITPRFLTKDPTTGEPTFVVVHAKIARGAFARWVIVNRVESSADLLGFNEIGYTYAPELSSALAPVFVCDEFGGKGLSIRMASQKAK